MPAVPLGPSLDRPLGCSHDGRKEIKMQHWRGEGNVWIRQQISGFDSIDGLVSPCYRTNLTRMHSSVL